ncbi:MAG: hypothetical protein ACYS17_13670 [Planctomycetota bacterium]|jgi:hypothetical protein
MSEPRVRIDTPADWKMRYGNKRQEKVVKKTITSITTQDLFIVEGGPIKVVELIGVVTTVIQTQANNTKLLVDPTEPATDTDICAVLNITGDAAGTVYTITGTFANAMVATTNGVVAGLATQFIVPVGTIEISCSATNTGAIDWYIRYQPLGPDSGVRGG